METGKDLKHNQLFLCHRNSVTLKISLIINYEMITTRAHEQTLLDKMYLKVVLLRKSVIHFKNYGSEINPK